MKKYLVIQELQVARVCFVKAQFDDYDKANTFAKLCNEQEENAVKYWVYEQSK